MTHEDVLDCREIARVIVKEVLEIHIQTCPHGRAILKLMCLSIGIAIGSGVTGGGVAVLVLKALGMVP